MEDVNRNPQDMDIVTLEYAAAGKLLQARAKSVAAKFAEDFFALDGFEKYRYFTRNFFSDQADGTSIMTVNVIDNGTYVQAGTTYVRIHFNNLIERVVFTYVVSTDGEDVIVSDPRENATGMLKVPHWMITEWITIANTALSGFESGDAIVIDGEGALDETDNFDYLEKPIKYTIEVDSLEESEVSGYIGDTFTLTLVPAPETTTWYSDNINVATVDEMGEVTIVGEGEVKIHSLGAFVKFIATEFPLATVTADDIDSAETSVDGTEIIITFVEGIELKPNGQDISIYYVRDGLTNNPMFYNSIVVDVNTRTITLSVDAITNGEVITLYCGDTEIIEQGDIALVDVFGPVAVTNNVPA